MSLYIINYHLFRESNLDRFHSGEPATRLHQLRVDNAVRSDKCRTARVGGRIGSALSVSVPERAPQPRISTCRVRGGSLAVRVDEHLGTHHQCWSEELEHDHLSSHHRLPEHSLPERGRSRHPGREPHAQRSVDN